jgi:hypothetical protein
LSDIHRADIQRLFKCDNVVSALPSAYGEAIYKPISYFQR